MNLQTYLSENKGKNLGKIEDNLRLIEINHKTTSGSIALLCHKNLKAVGISFDENQLQDLLNYLPAGEIYFIAPKIKKELYDTLKNYYTKGKLKFFEYTYTNGEYYFDEIKGQQLITTKIPLETIAATLIDMLPRKYSNIKKAYKLITSLK
ncbi:MAG: hypothetical protein ACP5N2_05515 [Candidatus Nanoarchaeia archaeon]